VTRRIKEAITNIRALHPGLGHHLMDQIVSWLS